MTNHPRIPESGSATVYSTSWCPYCARLRSGLREAGVSFVEIDVDDDLEAAAFVESVNGGNRVVPTVVTPDGATRTNPAAALVAADLAGG